MNHAYLPFLLLTLFACSGPTSDRRGDAAPVVGEGPVTFTSIDDNLHHDTLLIQVSFDLGDGTYVMVASNVEDTFEGLRLYRYRPGPDGGVDMLAVSSPAYDSWTMRPTFFRTGRTGELWVLANFGERESWGQKILLLDRNFTDRGFMDVALPERVMEDDTLRLKRRDIAPHVRVEERDGITFFRFACDSVYLYDDQAGGHDRVAPSSDVHFTWSKDDGLALWMKGTKRLVEQPS